MMPVDLPQEEYQKIALADESVQKHIGDKQVIKVIFVPNKLINLIVG
jgi:leucyl-tRNA synthetase